MLALKRLATFTYFVLRDHTAIYAMLIAIDILFRAEKGTFFPI